MDALALISVAMCEHRADVTPMLHKLSGMLHKLSGKLPRGRTAASSRLNFLPVLLLRIEWETQHTEQEPEEGKGGRRKKGGGDGY
jgi:hypothetical protein